MYFLNLRSDDVYNQNHHVKVTDLKQQFCMRINSICWDTASSSIQLEILSSFIYLKYL